MEPTVTHGGNIYVLYKKSEIFKFRGADEEQGKGRWDSINKGERISSKSSLEMMIVEEFK